MASAAHLPPASPIVTVISYSSNEQMFAEELLSNAALYSSAVVLCVGDRLYTGQAEDEASLEQLLGKHPLVRVARYPVPDDLLATPVALHNRARQAGVAAAAEAAQELGFSWRDTWVLLLDADELPDGARVASWWAVACQVLSPRVVLKMQNYWAFLSPRLVADVHEDSVLLVHSSLLTGPALAHVRERDGIYMTHQVAGSLAGADPVVVLRQVPGLDSKPLFCHMSWVRQDRAALHQKVRNWGHRDDRDWHALIDGTMDMMDRGVWPTHDFVHGYSLRVLPSAQSSRRCASPQTGIQ